MTDQPQPKPLREMKFLCNYCKHENSLEGNCTNIECPVSLLQRALEHITIRSVDRAEHERALWKANEVATESVLRRVKEIIKKIESNYICGDCEDIAINRLKEELGISDTEEAREGVPVTRRLGGFAAGIEEGKRRAYDKIRKECDVDIDIAKVLAERKRIAFEIGEHRAMQHAIKVIERHWKADLISRDIHNNMIKEIIDIETELGLGEEEKDE
jgi:hypothetical protein